MPVLKDILPTGEHISLKEAIERFCDKNQLPLIEVWCVVLADNLCNCETGGAIVGSILNWADGTLAATVLPASTWESALNELMGNTPSQE